MLQQRNVPLADVYLICGPLAFLNVPLDSHSQLYEHALECVSTFIERVVAEPEQNAAILQALDKAMEQAPLFEGLQPLVLQVLLTIPPCSLMLISSFHRASQAMIKRSPRCRFPPLFVLGR